MVWSVGIVRSGISNDGGDDADHGDDRRWKNGKRCCAGRVRPHAGALAAPECVYRVLWMCQSVRNIND